jgi:Tol biopolymer transport system component
VTSFADVPAAWDDLVMAVAAAVGAWGEFFVAQAGAAAVLAGLVFVGVSINLGKIVAIPSMPSRALEAMVLLVVILVQSSLMLVPEQSLTALGFEVLAVALVVWVALAAIERDASFSPDGRSMLFVRATSRTNDDRIYVMRRDGSGVHPLRRDSLQQQCPRFSPDGRKISFWRGRDGQSGAYFVMNADGTGLRRISGGQKFVWGCPSWFPDGKRVVFTKDYNLYVASADGTHLKRLTDYKIDSLYRPAVSPDGRWLACDGSLPGRHGGNGIIVMRADGTGARRITRSWNEIQNDSGPAWSPDGKRIVFAGYRPRFRYKGVYVVNRDGSGLRRLSNFRH